MDAESVLYSVRGNQEIDLDELTFKLIVRSRDKPDPGPPYTVTLMAPSAQEKAAWTSDISQVLIINLSAIPKLGELLTFLLGLVLLLPFSWIPVIGRFQCAGPGGKNVQAFT